MFTLAISYEELGRTTGKMAARILKGEDISTMAIEYDQNPVKKYNPVNCAALGITPPEGYEAISMEGVEVEDVKQEETNDNEVSAELIFGFGG